jgi:hypothetical protein
MSYVITGYPPFTVLFCIVFHLQKSFGLSIIKHSSGYFYPQSFLGLKNELCVVGTSDLQCFELSVEHFHLCRG